jgi:hypothetical protein
MACRGIALLFLLIVFKWEVGSTAGVISGLSPGNEKAGEDL